MIVKNLLTFECLLKLSYCQNIEKRIYYNTLIVATTTRKKKTTNKTTTKQPQKHFIDKNVGQYISSFANNFFSSSQTFSILLLLSDNTLMYAPKLNLSKRLQTIDF